MNTTSNTETVEVLLWGQRRRRKLEREGALAAVFAGEAVVPASQPAAARAELARLQHILGKKTLEAEILRGAAEVATAKKRLARSPSLPGQTVTATFAKDCRDWEVIAWRAWAGKGLPGEPIRELLIEAVERCLGNVQGLPCNHRLEFSSDNGSAYIATNTQATAHSLSLTPITTPVCSPLNSGMAESLVNSSKRDYAAFMHRTGAPTVLA